MKSCIFVVNTWKDQHLLKRLISQVTSFGYPIIVIADGVLLEPECKVGKWFELERLKGPYQGGKWTQRYLKLYLEHSDADYCLRVDPDTCVWRKFELPVEDCDLFGTINPVFNFIRGGCIGWTRKAAERAMSSNFLLDAKHCQTNYARYWHFKWPHEEQSAEPLAFQDRIVKDVSDRLNFKLHSWSEVNILGNTMQIPEKGDYAITHPHPTL